MSLAPRASSSPGLEAGHRELCHAPVPRPTHPPASRPGWPQARQRTGTAEPTSGEERGSQRLLVLGNLEDPLSHLVSRAELWPLLCPSRLPERTKRGSPREQDKSPSPLLQEPEARGQGLSLLGETVLREEERPCGPFSLPQPKAGLTQGRCFPHPCSSPQRVTLSWRSPVSSQTTGWLGFSRLPPPQPPGLL